ncbi:MAG TPA: NIPSNAP family protein [Sphingomonas sp.]|nr:NIPSNAP family protein [Sphingomonas sp.]
MLARMVMTGLVLGCAAAADATGTAAASDAAVVELRQYKLVQGRGEAFVALFDRTFVENQEALGMRLVGQFRDLDDPDRFVWIRGFSDMAERTTALNAFYFGPVWQAHRDEANPMLDDNDNVLLLHPAAADLAFGPAAPRAASGTSAAPGGVVMATIVYLWKRPDAGFTAFFRAAMKPAIEAAGLPVLGAYVPEETPNGFPRLPVRPDTKVFVWFTRADDAAALDAALRRMEESPHWREHVAPQLGGFEERAPQRLRLAPTPRSALR